LRTVARNLTPGGLYLMEANHPRDIFRVGKSLKNEWTSERDDIRVHFRWGNENNPFDPITQLTSIQVNLAVARDGREKKYQFTNVDRALTYHEFQLLIARSEVFDIPTWLGVLDVNQPFDNSKQSVRMMPVLRRR
jgi:hypothetical protein